MVAPPDQDLSGLAREVGLSKSTSVKPIGPYLRDLRSRWDFISALAHGRDSAEYMGTMLGRFWQVLAPILNAAVYYFAFGVLLNAKKGIENYTAFLIAGMFTFQYISRCIRGGTKAIANNRQLIRAVHFPRAILPLSVLVQEFRQQLASLVILCIIVLATGEPLTANWLAVIPITILQSMFCAGLCFLFARWTAASRDVNQLVPFIIQTWRYLSGVFYSIAVMTADMSDWVRHVLYANPATTYIELIRDAMMTSHKAPTFLWWYAGFWGIFTLLVGFWFFYRGEESYARG
jgi:teichoic acid transport system permease protein